MLAETTVYPRSSPARITRAMSISKGFGCAVHALAHTAKGILGQVTSALPRESASQPSHPSPEGLGRLQFLHRSSLSAIAWLHLTLPSSNFIPRRHDNPEHRLSFIRSR